MKTKSSGFTPVFAGIVVLLVGIIFWQLRLYRSGDKRIVTNSTPLEIALTGGEIRINGFESFKLTVPKSGWTRIDHGDVKSTELVKENYKIIFSYQPHGSLLCVYSRDPNYGDGKMVGKALEYPKFAKYVELKAQNITMRRGVQNGSTSENGLLVETVCQKNSEGVFTEVGPNAFIIYSYPQSYNKRILQEMDNILTSLRK